MPGGRAMQPLGAPINTVADPAFCLTTEHLVAVRARRPRLHGQAPRPPHRLEARSPHPGVPVTALFSPAASIGAQECPFQANRKDQSGTNQLPGCQAFNCPDLMARVAVAAGRCPRYCSTAPGAPRAAHTTLPAGAQLYGNPSPHLDCPLALTVVLFCELVWLHVGISASGTGWHRARIGP
jgi:hypothetical protein